jgi:hypothetical protein
MRKSLLIAFTLLCFTGLAAAQIPTSGNVFFGYSYVNTDLSPAGRNSTNGWEASVEGKVLPFIGIAADLSAYYGSENVAFPTACPVSIPNCNATIVVNVGTAEHNYLFGPRVSISVSKFRPFAEALVGAGHINAHAAGSDTSFATAIGGGLDYRLFRILAWRLQGDYLQTRFFSRTQNNVRISTGIVVRF